MIIFSQICSRKMVIHGGFYAQQYGSSNLIQIYSCLAAYMQCTPLISAPKSSPPVQVAQHRWSIHRKRLVDLKIFGPVT